MSDLVERVAVTIALQNGHSLYDGLPETPIDACASAAEGRTYYCKDDYRDLARAAIKAVAEWVREAGGDDMYARAFSKMIFDELKEGSE